LVSHIKFHHLPGQSWYTCGIEATIDGKRCVFTADNFFHQDQFSGSGGWMGLNRSSPAVYGLSAKKVLDIAPEWVLAEHGGPYVFDAQDYRRRVQWGIDAGKACDALCVSGNHLRDWTPHRVTAEPHLQQAKAGDTVTVRVAVSGVSAETVNLTVQGRGVFTDQSKSLIVVPGIAAAWEPSFALPADLKPGRHVFAVRLTDAHGPESADAYFVVENK
jgi:hypothetical protein